MTEGKELHNKIQAVSVSSNLQDESNIDILVVPESTRGPGLPVSNPFAPLADIDVDSEVRTTQVDMSGCIDRQISTVKEVHH